MLCDYWTLHQVNYVHRQCIYVPLYLFIVLFFKTRKPRSQQRTSFIAWYRRLNFICQRNMVFLYQDRTTMEAAAGWTSELKIFIGSKLKYILLRNMNKVKLYVIRYIKFMHLTFASPVYTWVVTAFGCN